MKENIKSLFIIVLGNVLLTSAYAFLTVPNNIINGGVTSTSLLLSYYFHIDIGYIVTILIVLLLIFGRVMLGKKFFYRSLFSSVCYMVFFNLFLLGANLIRFFFLCHQNLHLNHHLVLECILDNYHLFSLMVLILYLKFCFHYLILILL